MGAMIPDWHLRQTVPKLVRNVCTLTADGSGNATSVFFPHPAFVNITNVGTFTGFPGYSAVSSVDYAYNNFECAGIWTAFRPVSMGLRIRCNLPALTAQGKVVIAPFVCGGNIPSYSFLQSASLTSSTRILDSVIGAVDFTANSQIWQVPGAKTFTLQEVIEDEVIVSARPGGPEAFAFRNCTYMPTFGTTHYRYIDVDYNATGPVLYQGNASFQCMNDLQAFMIVVTGAPANAIALEIDYIMHLEVQECPSATAGTPFTSVPVSGRSDPTAYLKDLSWSDRFDSIARTTGHVIGSASRFVQAAVGGMGAGYYGAPRQYALGDI